MQTFAQNDKKGAGLRIHNEFCPAPARLTRNDKSLV